MIARALHPPITKSGISAGLLLSLPTFEANRRSSVQIKQGSPAGALLSKLRKFSSDGTAPLSERGSTFVAPEFRFDDERSWRVLPNCRLKAESKSNHRWLTFAPSSFGDRLSAENGYFFESEVKREPDEVWESAKDILTNVWTSGFQLRSPSKTRLLGLLDSICSSPKEGRPFSDNLTRREEVQRFVEEWSPAAFPVASSSVYFGPREQSGFILNRVLSHSVEAKQPGKIWLALRLAWNAIARAAEYLMQWSREASWHLDDSCPWMFSWTSLLARSHDIEVRRENFANLEGCLIHAKNKYVIHVADRLGDSESGQVIGHELAHLYRRHSPNSSYGMDARTLDIPNVRLFKRQESEADELASLILHYLAGIRAIGMNMVAESSMKVHAGGISVPSKSIRNEDTSIDLLGAAFFSRKLARRQVTEQPGVACFGEKARSEAIER